MMHTYFPNLKTSLQRVSYKQIGGVHSSPSLNHRLKKDPTEPIVYSSTAADQFDYFSLLQCSKFFNYIFTISKWLLVTEHVNNQ